LAPFYDLVCTRIYGSHRPRMVDAIVEEFIEVGPRRFDEAVTEFVEQHGDSPVVESMRLQVAKQFRRARRALD